MAICNFSNTGLKTTRCNDINNALGASALAYVYSGAPPSDASVAATGTLLATLTCASSAFGVVTAGVSGGATPYLTANTIPAVNGTTSGTPGYIRFAASGGTAVVDLDCGASGSGASVICTPDTVTAGAPFQITSCKISEA